MHAKSVCLSPSESPESPFHDPLWEQKQAREGASSRIPWRNSKRIWTLVCDLIPPNCVKSGTPFALSKPWASGALIELINPVSFWKLKHAVSVWYLWSSFYELLKGNLDENHFRILTQLEELGKFCVLNHLHHSCSLHYFNTQSQFTECLSQQVQLSPEIKK